MLRDIFTIGVYNDSLGERLLTENAATITLDDAVAKAETVERAMRDRNKVQATPQVNAVLATNNTAYSKRPTKCHLCVLH